MQTPEHHALPGSCSGGFLAIDSDLKIEFANQGVTEMFGYAADEVIGQPASFLLPEFGRAQSTAGEFTAKRKDGQVFTADKGAVRNWS
jgi:PAS domain-containing protein